MSAVAAPADRRFRRAHVKPGRKGRGWAARATPVAGYALVVVVVLFGGYRGSRAIAQAHVLRIDRITIRGNQHLSQSEVLAALSGLRGESLIWSDLGQWRIRLLSSPWVRDAALRRSLPSTVDVVVSERQPIGIARLKAGDMYLMDERGVMIDRYGPQYASFDLPIVDGLVLSARADGSTAEEAGADLAARVITALKMRPDVGRRLSQVDVSDPHNAAVILAGDLAVIALGDDRFLARLQNYLELASGLRGTVPEIDHVDARFENRMYVRPAARPDTNTARTPAPLMTRPGKNSKRR